MTPAKGPNIQEQADARKQAVKENDPRQALAASEPAAPEPPAGFFEGTGCILTLRNPWHVSGNQRFEVAHTAKQVRDRLRRGEFARFDRLGDLTSRERDENNVPTLEWSGKCVFHEIHIRSAEVVLIDEREFGISFHVPVPFDLDGFIESEMAGIDEVFPLPRKRWWQR